MKVTPPKRLYFPNGAVILVIGLLAGGVSAVALIAPEPQVIYREAASAVAPIARAEAMVVQAPAESTPVTDSPEADPSEIKLTDRERLVLARLASLPDLPVVQAPAFDLKVQSAPGKVQSQTVSVAKTAQPVAPKKPAGESVIARIQVVSVEKGRVFYRSVDDQMHTARVGERLLGVNGRVLAIDEQGAELQIEGQRMRVAANNM